MTKTASRSERAWWLNGESFSISNSCWLGGMSLAEDRVQEGESMESVLRRFKRKVQTEGHH